MIDTDFWKNHDVPTKPRMITCTGCKKAINDQFILRVNPNLEFHASCLKCSECSQRLDESSTVFIKDGVTFCKQDYHRLFANKCCRCNAFFTKSEMVMRAGHLLFHTGCFTCTACDRRLETGDEFRVKNGQMYCRNDCEAGALPDTSAVHSAQMYEEDSWETSTLTSLDHTSSPPLSPKSDGMETPVNCYQPPSGGSSGSSGGGKKKKDKQTTRVRTVLNETQLKILKQCYSVNSRPDALLKEQLVEMTGLNARVIRVWFQNKRCKDKKRQIQIHESRLNAEKERALNGVRMSGIGPLIAQAPSNHVDHLGAPIEISHYAPAWNGMEMSYPPPPGPPHHPMGYDELTDLTFGSTAAMSQPGNSFQPFSPHLHTSDMSSPSCSE